MYFQDPRFLFVQARLVPTLAMTTTPSKRMRLEVTSGTPEKEEACFMIQLSWAVVFSVCVFYVAAVEKHLYPQSGYFSYTMYKCFQYLSYPDSKREYIMRFPGATCHA